MNISFPSISNINCIKRSGVSFGTGTKGCFADKFKRNETVTVSNHNHELTGKPVRDISLGTRDGGKVNGFILRDKSNPNQYFVCVDGKTHCRSVFYEKGDSIYISELYGDRNEGPYKGAGTALLKFAAEESIKKGHKGKMCLTAGGSLPFYYKNNFRSADKAHYTEDNALFDYLSRVNNPTTGKFFHFKRKPDLIADEKAAKALLEGKRLTEGSKSGTLFSFPAKTGGTDTIIDVDFYDGGDKYVIQLMDRNDVTDVRLAYLTGEIKDGKLLNGETIEQGKTEPSVKVCEITEKGRLLAEQRYNTK